MKLFSSSEKPQDPGVYRGFFFVNEHSYGFAENVKEIK
jgi:hypothetical protein